ncbi:MAG: glycoside hydrolase family 31 protein [Deltaproteobacteria bacterium]|nr:glycoside hydrolase family 31 protein [Deltaproteobacteria bacterium]
MNRHRPITSALLLLAVLLGGCGNGGPSPVPVRITSGDAAVEVSADRSTLTLLRKEIVLLTFPADAFQLGTVPALDDSASYDPYWLEPEAPIPVQPPEGLEWRQVTSAELAPQAADRLELTLKLDGGLEARLTVTAGTPGRFAMLLRPDRVPDGMAVAFVRLRPRAGAAEGFYGLGDAADDVNQRGKLRPMQMEFDANLESSDNEAHVPIPLLIGTTGWGLFVESRRVGLFDVARGGADLVQITYGTAEQSGDGLAFHLFAADHPLDVTKHYYDVTGYPNVPAPWALGPWFWRDETTGQAQVEEDIATLRSLDLATSAIWIDRPYASAVNTFDFQPDNFPDPSGMIQRIHDQGFRLALWHSPYVEDAAEPYRSEAVASGYFPPQVGILLNKWSKPLDLTNPAAFSWWQGLIHQYTDMGIEGFKLDYAEDVVPGIGGARSSWKVADGSDDRTAHYDYQLLYHRVYAETLPATGGFLLCRTGRWGDQKNVSVIWPGDMDATFTRQGETFLNRDGDEVVGVGGLPATMIVGLNLGPSGFPFYGADTGGYRHSPPPKEVYVRWFQQTALSSVMQIGDSSSEPVWEFTAENGRDQETVDLYRTYVRLHLRLFPYEWTYAQRISQTGRPIQRPFGLQYPELGVHPWDQYMFGDDLLVAPVLTEGATSRTMVLPPGDWIDWWDGTRYAGGAGGGSVEVPAPLDKLPLFLRAGASVPMLRPTIDTAAPATVAGIESYANDPGRLYVRVFPGPPSVFALYDSTVISQNVTSFSVAPGRTFTLGTMLEIVGTSQPGGVDLGGTALTQAATPADLDAAPSGWAFEAATGGTVWVKLPAAGGTVSLK